MPNLKSGKKELRKSTKRQARNVKIKSNLKKLVKQGGKLIESKDKEAKTIVAKALKSIDKAVQKGILKKNTGNRKKSRLHKKLNKMQK